MSSLIARLAAGLAALAVCAALATLAGPALVSSLGGGGSPILAVAEHGRGRNSAMQLARGERAGDIAEQVAQTRTARFAAILAAPCADAELLPNSENTSRVDGAVRCLINHERAEHRVLPLSSSPDLGRAAVEHVRELLARNYFAHVTPSGYTPADRIRATGYVSAAKDGWVLGENLAWGTYSLSTPAAVVAAWVASPGHLANILEPRYTETGIGVTPHVPSSLAGGKPGALYAEEFGVILN